MKKIDNSKKRWIVSAALSLLSLAAVHAADSTIVTSATQPLIGPDDIYSYTEPVGTANGGRDYSNNRAPGETFTTLANSLGYDLNSVTVQDIGGGDYQGDTYALAIYSYTGGTNGTITLLDEQQYTFASSTDSNPYLTFDLTTPFALSANTQYAYTISAINPSGYLGFAGSGYDSVDGDTYSGGIAFQSGIAAGADPSTTAANTSIYNGATYDRNFDIGLTAIEAPEPSTWALMLVGSLGCMIFANRLRRLASRDV